MSRPYRLSPEVEQLLHTLEGEQPDQPEPEDVTNVYVEDYEDETRVTFIRRKPMNVNSTQPPPSDKRSLLVAGMFFLLLVTIIIASALAPAPDYSKSFTVTAQGYALAPVHKAVTVTAKATGKGYIAPTFAAGEVTFYNSATYTQIIPVATVLKGQDGVTVITDEQAVIPPVTQTIPPTDGIATVPAHALSPGAVGNIPAGAINEACCVTSVLVQNASAFSGGRDGQHFTYVTKQDIYHAVDPLLTQLENTTPQLFKSVALLPQCIPTIAATPPVGQRAQRVSITATVQCTAVSYSPQSVQGAIQSYGTHLGRGTLSSVAYQVIATDKKERITFYVTATWQPLVIRHMWAGK